MGEDFFILQIAITQQPKPDPLVEVSVYVVRAFVALRELLAGNKELTAKLNELAHKVNSHDQAIAGLINAMRELMKPPEAKPKRPIGFVRPEE